MIIINRTVWQMIWYIFHFSSVNGRIQALRSEILGSMDASSYCIRLHRNYGENTLKTWTIRNGDIIADAMEFCSLILYIQFNMYDDITNQHLPTERHSVRISREIRFKKKKNPKHAPWADLKHGWTRIFLSLLVAEYLGILFGDYYFFYHYMHSWFSALVEHKSDFHESTGIIHTYTYSYILIYHGVIVSSYYTMYFALLLYHKSILWVNEALAINAYSNDQYNIRYTIIQTTIYKYDLI